MSLYINLSARVHLFNDFIFLQLVLLSALVFTLLASDYLFLVLNSTLFLVIFGVLLWFAELDVYVNFLMVIDLGVFFVLAALLVNFVPLFQSHISSTFSTTLVSALLLFSVSSYLLGGELDYYSTPEIIFYNWADIFGLNYFSDLQLLSDIYYVFNCFEFLIMNLYLYLTILTVYIFFTLKRLLEVSSVFTGNMFQNNGAHSVVMKQQDFHKQSQQLATVRVWSRNTQTSGRL